MQTMTPTAPMSPVALNNAFFTGILESLMDGVLILTAQGRPVHVNSYAQAIYQRLVQSGIPATRLDQEVARLRQAALDSADLYPDSPIIIESELTHPDGRYRMRARSIELDVYDDPLVLITLEDKRRTVECLAIAEVQKYGLTPREAEVWLLRRANRTYKEIARELFISLNTVKKHLKNIHAKLKFYEFRQDLIASGQ